jgi:hypothetical protein
LPASLRRRGDRWDEAEVALVAEAKEVEEVEDGVADAAVDGGGRGPWTSAMLHIEAIRDSC